MSHVLRHSIRLKELFFYTKTCKDKDRGTPKWEQAAIAGLLVTALNLSQRLTGSTVMCLLSHYKSNYFCKNEPLYILELYK